jgi:hypothetical protein
MLVHRSRRVKEWQAAATSTTATLKHRLADATTNHAATASHKATGRTKHHGWWCSESAECTATANWRTQVLWCCCFLFCQSSRCPYGTPSNVWLFRLKNFSSGTFFFGYFNEDEEQVSISKHGLPWHPYKGQTLWKAKERRSSCT